MDRFYMYLKAASRIEANERQKYVVDTASAIGGLFSKDGVRKYLKELEQRD